MGVNPNERMRKQKLIVSVTIFTDLTDAGLSDSLDNTIDYSGLTDSITGYVESSSCMLIERVAEEIARICLEPVRSAAVTVLVKKPGALKLTKNVGVEIYRSSNESKTG